MSGRYRWLVRWLVAEYEAQLPPPTRGDCKGLPRPCPRRLCKWHMSHRYNRQTSAGSRLRVVSLDNPCDEESSCALDMADKGPQEYATIGRAMGYTGQTMINDCNSGLAKMREDLEACRALENKNHFDFLATTRAVSTCAPRVDDVDSGRHYADQDDTVSA